MFSVPEISYKEAANVAHQVEMLVTFHGDNKHTYSAFLQMCGLSYPKEKNGLPNTPTHNFHRPR